MKTSRFIAGLSAAIIATSMTAAIPASAGGTGAASGSTTSVANFDLIDVVNAFKDAGIDNQNVQNLRNFLILNCEFFDGNDYQDMINTINMIKTLYIEEPAMRLCGKTPAQLSQAERYHIYDNLQPAAVDSIKKKIEKLGTAHAVKTEWSTQTVNGDKTYALWYGSLDTSKAKPKSDSTGKVEEGTVKTGTAAKISKCTIKLAGNKIEYKEGVKRAPKVTVTYNGSTLVKNRDYTLSYKNIDKMGKASIVITGKGNFSGKKTVYFYIVPKQSVITLADSQSRNIRVKIAKDSTLTSSDTNSCKGGYQIQFSASTSSDPDLNKKEREEFKSTLRTYSTKNYDTTFINFNFSDPSKQFQPGSIYCVRVRAFITVQKADGQTERHYGAWSDFKTVTVK